MAQCIVRLNHEAGGEEHLDCVLFSGNAYVTLNSELLELSPAPDS